MPTPVDAAYLTALALASPWLAKKLMTSPKARTQLFAKLSGKVQVQAKRTTRVWFHGVSVGEIHLLRHLIAQFSQRRPDCEVVVSASTDTGLCEARRLFDQVFAWPFDFSWAIQEAFARVQPDLLVLAESEIWPGVLIEAHRLEIPVVLINARLAPKSVRRWKKSAYLSRGLWSRFAGVATQNHDFANHFEELGISPERIAITGSVKFDGVQSDRGNPDTHRLADLFNIQPNDLIWVAGSTQSPEEDGCIRIYQDLLKEHPSLRLVMVPRQKDRFDDVASLLRRSGLPFVRRSSLPEMVPPNALVLVDTIGELRAVWGLADIAFVGGSLDGLRGGQNMIEPAAYGAGVIFGKDIWNFQTIADELINCGGAMKVRDFDGLRSAVSQLTDDATREKLGNAAMQFVSSHQGATKSTLDFLDQFLTKIPSPQAA